MELDKPLQEFKAEIYKLKGELELAKNNLNSSYEYREIQDQKLRQCELNIRKEQNQVFEIAGRLNETVSRFQIMLDVIKI